MMAPSHRSRDHNHDDDAIIRVTTCVVRGVIIVAITAWLIIFIAILGLYQ